MTEISHREYNRLMHALMNDYDAFSSDFLSSPERTEDIIRAFARYTPEDQREETFLFLLSGHSAVTEISLLPRFLSALAHERQERHYSGAAAGFDTFYDYTLTEIREGMATDVAFNLMILNQLRRDYPSIQLPETQSLLDIATQRLEELETEVHAGTASSHEQFQYYRGAQFYQYLTGTSFDSLSPASATASSTEMIAEYPLGDRITPYVRAISEGQPIVDYNIHHNQFLDGFTQGRADGRIGGGPYTLIHFDTHADMKRVERPEGEDLASFVNRTMHDGIVNEVYWVLPDATRQEPHNTRYWEFDVTEEPDELYINSPRDETIYYNTQNGEFYYNMYEVDDSGQMVIVPDPRIEVFQAQNPNPLREITIHKVIASELPDMAGRQTLLSLDGDYFHNTGYDTAYNLEHHFTEAGAENVFRVLAERNAHPDYISMTLSPGYTGEVGSDGSNQVWRLFQSVTGQLSGDYLVGYQHDTQIGLSTHPGVINDVRDTPLERALDGLTRIDAFTTTSDRAISLTDDNPELSAALDVMQRMLSVDGRAVTRDEAMNILRSLDRLDNPQGLADGMVSIQNLETNLPNTGRSLGGLDINELSR